ncbi:hypothetical protein KQ940_19260 [Marinobacterium sp. D7]|uniref:hypothetical protein n=1 Tax=Marinobacterium ramblicola TaxID=2849041 RepID=UPI001C2D8B44|nr:hypothetical protein [Marinobacterium ramblicola]MBV1790199.1 hypothetical protein [Marinobacterium ramblicola]
MTPASSAKSALFLQLPFWCALAALLYGLLRPQSPPDLFYQSDKWLHLLAFAALAVCARVAFHFFSTGMLWGTLLLTAPGLELLQHLLQPHRTFSLYDALANLTGVILGAAMCWVFQRGYASRARVLRW